MTNLFSPSPTRGCSAFTLTSTSPNFITRHLATTPKTYFRQGRYAKKSDGNKEIRYRADRVLSHRFQKSRSECHELLKKKRVWKVDPDGNLSLVLGPAERLSMNDDLRLDKTKEIPLPPPLLMVYHKPKWVLSVRQDPYNRPCLDESILPNMHPVGRLDYDTSGLLLFSSSGALTQRLLHPKHEVEKEYVAVVTGIVVEDELRATLAAGVQTTEGSHKATLESVDIWERSSIAPYLLNIQRNFPPEYNQTDLKVRGYLNVFDAQALSTVRLTVSEGKHRMVRRILANCGHPVVSLHRDRLGAVALNDLPAGEYRPLTTEESPWAETLVPLEKKHIKPKPKTDRKSVV